MKELYIDRGIAQSRACIIENGRAVELYIENHDNKNISGNIYLGRIENITESLNAAFVNIGTGKNAILHFEDSIDRKLLKRGNQILVQVVREPSGDKGPRVSTKLSLPGRNIVFLPETNYIGISKKITSEDLRKSLRKAASEIVKDDGIIIRTEGAFDEIDLIKEEYNELRKVWKHIRDTASYIKAPKLVFDSRNYFEFLIREFVRHDIDRVVVNNENTYSMLKGTFEDGKNQFINRIDYNEFDFSRVKFIKKIILNLFNERIELDSGGYIIINESEALVSIDVNSGTFTEGVTQRETSLKVNLNACREISRIIKLRNLSGIIIIDFIDVPSEEERSRIIEELDLNLKADRASHKIYDFTKLGLLEMTRSRKGKRTLELVYEDINKKIFNTSFLLKEMENECAMICKHKKKASIDVYVNENILMWIDAAMPNYAFRIKEYYGVNVNFILEKDIENYIVDEKIKETKRVKIEMYEKTFNGILDSISEEDGKVTIKITKE